MQELAVDRTVHAPAAEVWAVVTDLERAQDVMAGIDRTDHVEGPWPRIGVGTTWDETRTMMGRSETQRLRCTAVDEAAMTYVVEADAHGAAYRSTVAVQPTGEASCRLSMSFGAEPRTTAAKVLGATVGRLMAGSTRRLLQADLDDVAAAVGPR